jgi:hypothetical protein
MQRAIVAFLCGRFFSRLRKERIPSSAYDLNLQRLSTAERQSFCAQCFLFQPTNHPSISAFCARRPYKNNKNLSTHETGVNRPIEKWYKV